MSTNINMNYFTFVYKFIRKIYFTFVYNFLIKRFRMIKKIINVVYKKYLQKENYRKYRKFNKETEKYLYECALNRKTNNVVTRHMFQSCIDLMNYEKIQSLQANGSNSFIETNTHITLPNNYKRECYGCSKVVSTFHNNYVFSCIACGDKFEKYRHLITSQKNKIALVTGARTKLGHQIVVKLLKAKCIVIGTTRNPEKMNEIYEQYSNEKWIKNLVVYPESLDFDIDNIESELIKLKNFIEQKYGKLDILINSASQTIRCREKIKNKITSEETNRYNDSKYLNSEYVNSWNMRITDFEQNEMEEIFRINIIAPTLLIKTLFDLIKKSETNPFIINVHAREGLIKVSKDDRHMHTNYGKASMHMLTRCMAGSFYKTYLGKKIQIHGCDPGWISIDEYYENKRPWIVPPCDEIDGASKILYPLFMNLSSEKFTRRQYNEIVC